MTGRRREPSKPALRDSAWQIEDVRGMLWRASRTPEADAARGPVPDLTIACNRALEHPVFSQPERWRYAGVDQSHERLAPFNAIAVVGSTGLLYARETARGAPIARADALLWAARTMSEAAASAARTRRIGDCAQIPPGPATAPVDACEIASSIEALEELEDALSLALRQFVASARMPLRRAPALRAEARAALNAAARKADEPVRLRAGRLRPAHNGGHEAAAALRKAARRAIYDATEPSTGLHWVPLRIISARDSLELGIAIDRALLIADEM